MVSVCYSIRPTTTDVEFTVSKRSAHVANYVCDVSKFNEALKGVIVSFVGLSSSGCMLIKVPDCDVRKLLIVSKFIEDGACSGNEQDFWTKL